ncbi:Sister chromatid cohesion protein PDS5-like B-B [Cucurbita argyrosperma subsp. argyrosperma]|nr:Sister chromatid cohesion protein PDS5-like B-B [Cucurbita argyrosperma subsp. argyrosperma]
MCLSAKELEELLMDTGNKLLNPPSSIDALLNALDKAECLLSNVEQSPMRSMREALRPLMKALISDKLLKHSEEDVKVTVTSCITEITRITAPDAPYDDEKMKVIFQLTLEAFRKLSNVSGRGYTKALSIIDAVAKVRSCLVMLDLECEGLILEMSNHPPAVFSAMETIMTNVLEESEEISSDLLRPILASVRKENKEAASISWKLGERVMTNCATKLQPCLMGTVQSIGASLDDYAPIVVSICRNGTDSIGAGNRLENAKNEEKGMNSNEPTLVVQTHTPNASIEENPRTDTASESLISNGTGAARNGNILKASSRKSQKRSEQSKTTETKIPDSVESTKAEDTLDLVPKKRGRKPNSLMNPDEGYDHYWIGKGRERFRLSNCKKSNDQETKFSPVSLIVEKTSLPTEINENMKKMEEIARARSTKSKVVKSKKNKPTEFSPVSPREEKPSSPTEVEKESSTHAEEKRIQPEDEVVNENMKKMIEKSQGRSKKSKVGKSKKDRALIDPGYVVSEENVSVPSDYKETRSMHLVMKLRVKNSNGDGSVVQKDVIVKSKDTNMEKNIHNPSTCEAKDSRSAKLEGDDYSEETSHEKATRKRAVVEKEVSYDDGDEEILNLKTQRYELIRADALLLGLIQDEEMDVPKSEASSDILRKRKRKRKNKSESDKEEINGSSTRRGRASAKRKSEAKSSTLSKKAANSSMLDDGGSINNSTKGNDKNLVNLIKNSRLRITLNSKPNCQD